MGQTRWWIGIPMALLMIGAPAWGSTIRDESKMFSPGVVEEAQRRLDKLERSTSIPVVIETVDRLGLAKGSTRSEKLEAINRAAKRRDQQIRDEGMYILISKDDHVISQPMIRARLQDLVPSSKRDAIRIAFTGEFKRGDYDGGLKRGVEEIEKTLAGHRAGKARAGAPVPVGAARGHAGGGSSMFGTFLLIGVGILAVLLILRVLGGLFGRSSGAGYPGPMGGQRPGMGPGPGYGGGMGGGPGYGGGYGGRGGGGFFSGLLGGLGGAMAGNWLYDQMSGRHGESHSASAYSNDQASSLPDQGDDAIMGADDHGGQGGSWDDGGSNTGGGDWGDGGGGGGGDWGGGGGDWGGGDGGGGGDW